MLNYKIRTTKKQSSKYENKKIISKKQNKESTNILRITRPSYNRDNKEF